MLLLSMQQVLSSIQYKLSSIRHVSIPAVHAILVQSTQHSLQILQGVLQSLKLMRANKRKFTILDGLSGRVTPGRMTLLLGPPGSGKSTLLMALAGKLRKSDLQACSFLCCLICHPASSHSHSHARLRTLHIESDQPPELDKQPSAQTCLELVL